MTSQLKTWVSSINWGRSLKIPVVLLGLLLLAVAMPAAPPRPMRVQSELWRMAAAQPEVRVAVIVQKQAKDQSVENLVTRLGGQVTRGLSIINAFAAEMPVGEVMQLAKAEGVRWVSLDAPVAEAGGPDGTVNTSNLANVYNSAVHADQVWAEQYQGSSVTVAVIDSGLNSHNDFKNRILTKVKTNSYPVTTGDNFGHGTHIAGVIAGDGSNSSGKYIGIAPKTNLVSVKVSNDTGMALTSDVVAGLQWVLDHKSQYNIRVTSISLNSSVAESYSTNPLDAAVEVLWFNRVVVVVSGGNNGLTQPGVLFPPANDPFVISVGASDDRGTVNTSDDVLASFSAYGTTESGFSKPDLVAPGKNIISTLASSGSVLSTAHLANRVSGANTYFRMSGTSMAAPIVAGAAALLLQSEPNLTPDQVKYRLKATGRTFSSGNGAPYLDIYAALHGTSLQNANTGFSASALLWTGGQPLAWGSVNWDSVNWDSVNWDSVNWDSVNWDSDYWGN
ncbi:MAG: S8 family serine peptidase [Chloroflexi bacterium]|nr:S8 family serine peptidase [Chloroflexota bacterium]